jgi:hypothetical protein
MPSVKREREEYDLAEPRASAMIESLRAFGYNIQTAIADLIDNSISARSGNIWVEFFWNGPDSYISIKDDGEGMTEQALVNAMRPGSQNPLAMRNPRDLGRFGLGLKTASFSQCRRLTVASRTSNSPVAIRRWDLDYVNQTDEWRLLHSPAPGSEKLLSELNNMPQGTIVLWECLDRIVGDARVEDRKAQENFLETIDIVEKHLAMVFHRYLEGRGRVKIWINDQPVEAWDPFLTGERATQWLPEEPFCNRKVIVQPYVLPHHTKIDEQTHKYAAGPKGWNAQQGFYIYRNQRLLVAGDWLGLGFQKEEHCKLARIQVDLPNTMDTSWNIDVKKSRARPPAALREDLKRIARITRREATAIYRHRGKVITRKNADDYVFPWERKIRRGKVFYAVNHKHPLIQEAQNIPKEYQPTIRAMLRLLEETVPVQQIWLDSSDKPDSHTQPFEGVPTKEVVEVINQIYQSLRNTGITPQQARLQLLAMEPFQHFEELIQNLPD